MTLASRPAISATFSAAAQPPAKRWRRGKTPPPFSLRFTDEEKDRLKREAGSMPLGAYIRSKVLADGTRQRRTYRRPVENEQALAQVLGELGKARLANNLNQLARAANAGALPITEDTVKLILTACKDVQQMRAMLMAALGLSGGEGSPP